MVACAQVSGQRGVVFPEATALAFGTWVMGRQDWCESRSRLVAAPVLCAVLGVVAANLIHGRFLAELAALSAAVTVLVLLPSRVSPSLSAAVLPTVFGIHIWVYPLAVLVLAVTVLVGTELVQRRSRPAGRWRGAVRGGGTGRWRGAVRAGGTGWWQGAAVRWPLPRVGVVYAVSASWLAIVAATGLPRVAAAPPLLVSCLEWIMEPAAGTAAGTRRGAAVVAAWTAGAVAFWQIPSAALAGFAALAFASALIWVFDVRHAPVLAMSLVAEVAGPPTSWAGVLRGALGVALAIAVMYVLGSVLGRALRWRTGLAGSPPGDNVGERDAGMRQARTHDRLAGAEPERPGE